MFRQTERWNWMLPFLATSVSGSFGSNTGFPTLSTLQNYMIKIWPRVQVTAVSGFIEQKSKHNYYCLPTSSQSIKLQRASRDTSLLANRIPVHIAGYLSGSEPDNTLQIEARWNCESRGLMDDNCVLNHTVHVFNEPWNCSKLHSWSF